MLVMEMADGSTEKSVVSRRQALEVAQVSNLDLVQGEKNTPVIDTSSVSLAAAFGYSSCSTPSATVRHALLRGVEVEVEDIVCRT